MGREVIIIFFSIKLSFEVSFRILYFDLKSAIEGEGSFDLGGKEQSHPLWKSWLNRFMK